MATTFFDINNIVLTVFGYKLSYVEFIGTLTGLFSVWYAAKSNICTWPIGLINVVCFFAIFYQVQLYSDMFLQAYFFAMSIYGWINWRKLRIPGKASIKILSIREKAMLSIGIIGATLFIGSAVKNIHLFLPQVFIKPASYPYTDTFVAVLSVIATVLLARKIIENWILWIIVDIISVYLYAQKNIYFISVEYFVFLCLAITGLVSWIKILSNEKGIGFREIFTAP